eukprot:gene12878-biopygen12818
MYSRETGHSLIDRYFASDGDGAQLVKHQTHSFNDFVSSKLECVINGMNPIEVGVTYCTRLRQLKSVLSISFTSPCLALPMICEKDGMSKVMYPNDARMRNMTYSSSLTVDANVEVRTWNDDVGEYIVNSKRVTRVSLGRIPLMVLSRYCMLSKQTTPAPYDECRYDYGGYFVVNGNEKVVISQDRISENRIYVFTNTTKTSLCYSHTAEVRSVNHAKFIAPKTTLLKLSKKSDQFGVCIRANVHHVRAEVPVFVLFRALGVLTDKDIVRFIVRDEEDADFERIANSLAGCIDEATEVRTQKQAWDFLAQFVQSSYNNYNSSKPNRAGNGTSEVVKDASVSGGGSSSEGLRDASVNGGGCSSVPVVVPVMPTQVPREGYQHSFIQSILTKDVLPHVGTCFNRKALYLGYMVNKLLRCSMGLLSQDDRDSYVNKRLDTPGVLLANLFRQYYCKMVKELRSSLQSLMKGNYRATRVINTITRPYLLKVVKGSIIESGLKYALSTGNWGIKTTRVRQGVAQVLNRLTFIATLSHLRRVNTAIEKTGKLVMPRKLHPTQWGMACPSETPEGTSVGLVKNLALLANVTIFVPPGIVLESLLSLGMLPFDSSSLPERLFEGGAAMVMLNGDIVGAHATPNVLFCALKRMKRTGLLGMQTSVCWHNSRNEIVLCTEGGRFCRPMLVVDLDTQLLLPEVFDPCASWQDLIVCGAIEYLDVEESDGAMIALYPAKDLQPGSNTRFESDAVVQGRLTNKGVTRIDGDVRVGLGLGAINVRHTIVGKDNVTRSDQIVLGNHVIAGDANVGRSARVRKNANVGGNVSVSNNVVVGSQAGVQGALKIPHGSLVVTEPGVDEIKSKGSQMRVKRNGGQGYTIFGNNGANAIAGPSVINGKLCTGTSCLDVNNVSRLLRLERFLNGRLDDLVRKSDSGFGSLSNQTVNVLSSLDKRFRDHDAVEKSTFGKLDNDDADEKLRIDKINTLYDSDTLHLDAVNQEDNMQDVRLERLEAAFNNAEITGDVRIRGNISEVASASVLRALNVNGMANLPRTRVGGSLVVSGTTDIGRLDVANGARVAGELLVDGRTVVKGNAVVGGNVRAMQELDAMGGMRVGRGLSVDGNAVLSGSTVTGRSSLIQGDWGVMGNAVLRGNLITAKDHVVSGGSHVGRDQLLGKRMVLGKSLIVHGPDMNIGGNLSTAKDLNVHGSSGLTVRGIDGVAGGSVVLGGLGKSQKAVHLKRDDGTWTSFGVNKANVIGGRTNVYGYVCWNSDKVCMDESVVDGLLQLDKTMGSKITGTQTDKTKQLAHFTSNTNKKQVNIIPVQEALPESILANLTLFVSTNRVNTEDVMVWKNLASQSTSEKGCLVDGSVVFPDLRFNRKPTLLDNDKNRPAFHLGTGTSLTGPPSHQIGIDGNRSFGIFFVARMTLPNHTLESSTKAFQIFANTSSNNAMTLMFLPEPQVVGVRIGSGDVILGDSKDTLRKPIYPDQFYLWMVSKSYSELEVTAVNLENHRLEPITMLRATLPPMKEQLILSNFPITINSDYMWNAGLMAFGISSMKFYTKDVLDLAQHYRDVFMDMDPEVLAFKKKIRALTDKVDATKECPFNKETCLACEGAVIDWNTPDWYLGDVHPRCLRAIARFCSANPNHKRCFCWAPSKIEDKDSACRKYRSIFDGSSP